MDAIEYQVSEAMEINTSELIDEIKAKAAADGKAIWTMRYKIGPVNTETHFFASSSSDARERAERYIAHLQKFRNSKIVLIGAPRPFAQDLDRLMEENPDV